MAIKLTKEELINRFHTRVRDFVTANTFWVAGTGLWNITVATAVSNSVAYGGPYNRSAYSTTAPDQLITPAHFSNKASADLASGNSIPTILKSFLTLYANNHQIIIYNTGNLAPPSYQSTVRLTDTIQSTKDVLQSDVNSVTIANNLVKGKRITSSDIDGFIDDCKNIWINRAYNQPIESFYYGFCHSSCHANHGSHGSRGRR